LQLAPLEKLTALLEDIFEAEDALPPDIDNDDLPAEYFSPLTANSANPLLHPNVIRKLTKYIGHVARPTKRIRLSARDGSGTGGTPRGKGRMAEVATVILSRVLKMLDRSVKAGEDLDPFGNVSMPNREKTASPRKKKAPKKDVKEKDDEDDGYKGLEEKDMVVDEVVPPQELTNSDFDTLTQVLDKARDSILAADCCIALLGSDRLPKQVSRVELFSSDSANVSKLYSEELITTCLSTIKNQLTKVVYPFVEASGDIGGHQPPLLQHLVKNISTTSRDHRRQLSETFQALSAVIPRINNLVSAELVVMSDTIIIQAVYIAIGPFFVVDSGGDGDRKGKKDNVVLSTLGKSAMRGLRLDALSLIRSVRCLTSSEGHKD
jgi:cohesin loading factor subunit SCC2